MLCQYIVTHTGAGVTGAILFGIAIMGFVFPVNDQGHTIPSLNDLCASGFGQMAQALDSMFGGSMTSNCLQIKYITYGIYGFGLIGIILIIVGAIVPSKQKEQTLICPYCNFVALTDAELLKHKSDNHLDKSPYKCGHCDFIGISEEILWNHYEEKHPDKKKW